MGPKMPVSLICESQTDVSSAIRNTLSVELNNSANLHQNDTNVQKQFVATAKRALLSKIEYEEVNNFNHVVHDMLKTKYIVLRPSTSTTTSTNNGKLTDEKELKTENDQRKSGELPNPKVCLFDRKNVQIGWKSTNRKWHVGAGMVNVGNTCYLNSALQALFHVPAFANWLISDTKHRETCEDKLGIQNGCIICAMARTLISSQQVNSQAFKPYLVYSKLRMVCKHLIPGQQEDAHEFIRYLMEAMEKAYLLRCGKPSQFDQYSKETTPINQILGGYLKSSVKCLACNHVSVTFQHFEDLLLDIRKANTVDEALDLYFSRERLEDMGYKCESCKKKVAATKQFSLERAPISLCIQLKRFSIVGNKLNKQIGIRQQLNLSKYSSKKDCNQQLTYRLVSMVTHLGASQHCGHYTAIGHTDAGSYYQFDDSCVRPISLQNVLHTNAYIMFYEMETQTLRNQSVLENNKLNNVNDVKAWLPLDRKETTQVRNSLAVSTVTSGPTLKPFIGPLLPNDVHQHTSTTATTSISSGSASGAGIAATVATATHSNENHSLRTNGSIATETSKIEQNGLSTDEKYNRDDNKHLKSKLINSPAHLEPKLKINRNPSPSKSNEFIEAPINNTKNFHKSINDSNNIKYNENDKHLTLKPKIIINTQSKITPTRLVPYDDDGDSDSNSGTETPECEVKTKAGPFQVTKNKLSPNHSSSHLLNNINGNKKAASMPDLTDEYDTKLTTAIPTPTPSKSNNYNLNSSLTTSNKRPGDILINGSTTAKLIKLNNSRGYGGPVVSWSGQQSNLEKEVNNDKKMEQKRQTLDADDAEMDRGHKKKLNTKQNLPKSNPGYNPFQEHQTNKNKWNISTENTGKKNHVYRQNPHHKHYSTHKNGFKHKKWS